MMIQTIKEIYLSKTDCRLLFLFCFSILYKQGCLIQIIDKNTRQTSIMTDFTNLSLSIFIILLTNKNLFIQSKFINQTIISS
jgi:hypothetical protein